MKRGLLYFFVMLKSKIYSMQDNNNINIIKSIIALGHEIGLHFDHSLYKTDKDTLNTFCNNECVALENIIGKKIEIISFHRPAKKLIGMKSKIAERYHAYMPELMEKTKYCSDSEGKWRFDDPEELIKNKAIKNIQLLTHPIWWTTPSNMSPEKKLHFFKRKRQNNKKRSS